jgi:hypothetical protein
MVVVLAFLTLFRWPGFLAVFGVIYHCLDARIASTNVVVDDKILIFFLSTWYWGLWCWSVSGCIIVNSVQIRSEFGKFAYTAICMRKCTLRFDNTCVFTRFHSVKNANTQLMWIVKFNPGLKLTTRWTTRPWGSTYHL